MSRNEQSSRSGTRRLVVPGFDPEKQPVITTSKRLPALDERVLQLGFIQKAFNSSVHWNVEPVFSRSFQADDLQLANIVPAAVLFPLVQRESGLHVLFTRRASHLYDHAGQICFPGGRIEDTDPDAIAAALRETEEETGISRKYMEYIGSQPSFLTSTRFTMKPIIGYIKPGFEVRPDSFEVAEVFEVPLSHLMNPEHHSLHRANLPAGDHRFYFSISWQSYFIWGATAALIRNFYHYLKAASTTVLDQ
ncbi:MAG TPA: CoA pyrophosphatase [Burkholderiaceae bacterium]|nr:CoA pyrophosphatase [Burkholderiaceae bacterium]